MCTTVAIRTRRGAYRPDNRAPCAQHDRIGSNTLERKALLSDKLTSIEFPSHLHSSCRPHAIRHESHHVHGNHHRVHRGSFHYSGTRAPYARSDYSDNTPSPAINALKVDFASVSLTGYRRTRSTTALSLSHSVHTHAPRTANRSGRLPAALASDGTTLQVRTHFPPMNCQ